MIHRETIWKDERVSVVELTPLAGQELPASFRRFRFRMAFQHILHSGPVIKSCDIGLSADSVTQAIEEAAKLRPIKEKELMDGLAAEVNKVLLQEANKVSATQPDIPMLDEEDKVSEK